MVFITADVIKGSFGKNEKKRVKKEAFLALI